MERDGRRLTHLNGRKVGTWAPRAALEPAPGPACPKHCDTATPPEHFRGDQYVCVCCGTEFTWKGGPS